jgi:hypothetical protein
MPEPWTVFMFGAAAVGVLVGLEWLRVLIGQMGPD